MLATKKEMTVRQSKRVLISLDAIDLMTEPLIVMQAYSADGIDLEKAHHVRTSAT